MVMKFGCAFFGMHPSCRDFFKQVQSDWEETNEMSPRFIQHKPDTGLSGDDIVNLLEGFFTVDEWNSFFTEFTDTVMADYNWRYGVNTVSTLSGLPVSKASVVATLAGDSTLSLAGAMKPGQVMNVQVVATSSLTATLPTASGWMLMDEDLLELSAGDVAEINIWCTGAGLYSVKTAIKL